MCHSETVLWLTFLAQPARAKRRFPGDFQAGETDSFFDAVHTSFFFFDCRF